jgi:Calcineurin-like phosphoesterase
MTYVKPAHLLITCATILLLASTLSCGIADRHPEGDGVVWFVQVTDPHLFLDTSKDADAAKKSTREKQEKLDQSALSDLWKQIPSLPHADRPLSFLVMTGDFGIEPCSIADISVPVNSPDTPRAKDCLEKVNKEKRSSQITVVADLLAGSPVRDIYLIPGNNDIPFETASDDGLAYFNLFIEEVQKRIDDSKKNVQLHNLNRCYLGNGAASSCYADIQDTPYRMLGFPSYSFKNREPGYESNTSSQEKQFETFRSLLDASRQAGKRVLVLTHIPLIDDPYTLAQDRYAGVTPPAAIDKDPKNARSVWSTWNVSKKLADEWQEAVASDSVTAVFAGHVHDSHKEIYQRPYLWSTMNDHKTGFSKLYMAPPLSVKNQDGSLIQARGFSLVGLDSDRIKYRIYWYNAESGSFAANKSSELGWGKEEEKKSSWWDTVTVAFARGGANFWQFACPGSLGQWAVLLIALVAAYLTVAQVWQIPAPENPLLAQNSPQVTPSTQAMSADGTQKTAAQTGATKSGFDPSPFASYLGKTVIAGLGGLAATVVMDSLGGSPNPADNKFYIVWFIFFFFTILMFGAALRSVGEALRERITIVRPRAFLPSEPSGRRLWQWLLSLRSPSLTILDTFVNLVQGRNQTLTRVFSDTIITQQRNVVCVAQVIRQRLNDLLLRELNVCDDEKGNSQGTKNNAEQAEKNNNNEDLKTNPQSAKEKKWLDLRDIRVNISVLSEDGSTVFYIARAPGSGLKVFTKRSVAWVSVFTGNMLWYKDNYFGEEIALFNNMTGIIPDAESKMMLKDYYQEREDDYKAFIILPVPFPRRAFSSRYVRGAIHISFRDLEQFERIWQFTLSDGERSSLVESRWKELEDEERKAKAKSFLQELEKRKPNGTNDPVLLSGDYSSAEKMLGQWCTNAEIRACLRQALAILGQLLYDFNENIYNSSKQADDCGS